MIGLVDYWTSLRLHLQIAFASGILLALTISIAAWFNIKSQEKELLRNTIREATSLARNLAITSSYHVITDKLDELESQLIQTVSFPLITKLRIYTVDGKTLAYVKKLDSGKIVAEYNFSKSKIPSITTLEIAPTVNWDNKVMIIWQPIKTSTVLGWVFMEVSLNEVVKLQQQTIIDNIIGATIAIVFDILCLLVILYFPVKSFWKVVNFAKLMPDKPGKQISFRGGSYEINYLINALNQSSLKLESQQNEINKKHKQLAHLASHDHLTQLPNRAIFLDRLENTIKNANRNNTKAVIIFIDLNDFKPVNDLYGHQTGDQLLQQLANRLRLSIRESDTLARFGGDEFVILLSNINRELYMDKIIKNILETISITYKIDNRYIVVTASIGVATYPTDGSSSEELLLVADRNMYSNKREYKKKIEHKKNAVP